jgi:muconolactone D-isomerase
MEWLVHTHNRLPADTPAAEREQLRAAEREHAMELRAEGVLRKLWRTPGSTGTVALYECRDATHLHEALSSLPMFSWLEVSVEPLADHPQEAQAAELAAASVESAEHNRRAR